MSVPVPLAVAAGEQAAFSHGRWTARPRPLVAVDYARTPDELADEVVLTTDDARREDPEAIA